MTIDGAVSDCVQLADQLAKDQGWVNLTTTFHNPYGVDAYATIAYEIANHRPDVVVLPIASGPLLVGMMKGFMQLHGQDQPAGSAAYRSAVNGLCSYSARLSQWKIC